MINASQGVDLLMDGFQNAFSNLVSSIHEEAEIQRMSDAQQAQAWKIHAKKIKEDSRTLLESVTQQLEVMRKVENAQNEREEDLISRARILNSKIDEFNNKIEYVETLKSKVETLDKMLKRQSANQISINLMRQYLTEKLKNVMGKDFPEDLTSNKQKELIEDHWNLFMETGFFPDSKLSKLTYELAEANENKTSHKAP